MQARSYWNGSWKEGSGEAIQSVNPSNPDEVLASAGAATQAEVAEAVESAQEGFKAWNQLTGAQRGDHLFKWADVVAASVDEWANALVKEVGKPMGEAKGEAGRCVAILRYYAGECVRPTGTVIPALAATSLQYSWQRPVGPVGLITPWNFPLAIPLWKAAPALAAGCSVVLKPSEMSSVCGALLAESAEKAGMPPGVFNVVQGGGMPTGVALVSHPGIKAVSFTGSVGAGKKIGEVCADRNIKFQGEMGGKNASIVMADGNLDLAAKLTAAGAMRYAGQKCTATSRVIVEKSVVEEFTKRLKAEIEALPFGDPADMATAIGPVISEASHQKLAGVLEREKGRVAHTHGAQNGKGYFVPCTVIEKVSANEPVAQEELFGPVLAVIEAEQLDHAIEIANATPFGLSSSIFTQDISKAMIYADRIEAGMVRINGDTTGVDPHAPFGGMKASSTHSREQGPVGMDFYQETKTVQINP